MLGLTPASPAKPNGASDGLIKDGTDASFMVDVIEASRVQPVIVDFWATWCGPCKTLTPAIEKAVIAAKGAVKLVKIDVDKNPAYAGQLRVQSIPAVYAFVNGQPVDGFMGAVPDSQLKAFIEKLSGPTAPSDIEELLAEGTAFLAEQDLAGAGQAFAQALEMDPENVKALAGLARCYLQSGDLERTAELIAMVPAGAKDTSLDSVKAALALASRPKSETSGLEEKILVNPGDLEARFNLANALAAQGHLAAAADHLLMIIERDRTWNDDAARKQLLTVFEAAGPMSDVAKQGRRRLSSILFS
ncbi:MAG: hypothetical protein RJA87_569 [Pseudomonadota bacterium]|jgi:putative thioredoxin